MLRRRHSGVEYTLALFIGTIIVGGVRQGVIMDHIVVVVAALVGGAGALNGVELTAEPTTRRPEVLRKLFDCRGISEVVRRAACYDAQVDALDAAERDRKVVVVDQAEVRRARRSLFGFPLPDLNLFSSDKDEKTEEVTRVETKVAEVSTRNGLLLTLEDGSRWVQSDSEPLATDPKPGETIVIRKAAMGSYFANIGTRRAIRVRRIN
jgi:hypothetical protein